MGGSLNPTLDSNYVAATMNAMVTSGSTGDLVLSSATGPHTLTVTGAMTVGSTTTSFGNVKLQNGASLNVGALTINENNATQISTSYLGDYNATTMSTITVGSGGLTFQGGASSAGASYSIGNGGYTTLALGSGNTILMTDGGNWGQWFVNCAVTANNLTVKGTDTLGATLVFGDYTGAATNKFVGTGITGTLTVGDSAHTSYTTYLQSNGSNDFGTGSGASAPNVILNIVTGSYFYANQASGTYTETLGGLNGAGYYQIVNNLGGTLTIDTTNTGGGSNCVYTGSLLESGSLNLVKAGAGSQTWTPVSGFSFTNVTVSGGTLTTASGASAPSAQAGRSRSAPARHSTEAATCSGRSRCRGRSAAPRGTWAAITWLLPESGP